MNLLRPCSLAALLLLPLLGPGAPGCGDPKVKPESVVEPADVDPIDAATDDATDSAPADTGSQADSTADTASGDLATGDATTTDTSTTDTSTTDTSTTDADTSAAVLPCSSPYPFGAPGAPQGFNHTGTRLLTVTQGDPNHRGQDVVAVAGAPQQLIGKFAYGPFDKDLKKERVEVFVQQDGPCGGWESMGTFETSDEGDHGTLWGIEDDGGRIYFELPEASRRPVGRYGVAMRVDGDHSVARFDLTVVDPGTQAVVFDIDGTLTTDDFELIKDLFDEIFAGTYKPDLYDGALALTETWRDRGYLVLYLTARPDWLKPMTRAALVDAGFPHGAMHLTDKNTQTLDTAPYKTAWLSGLLTAAQLDIVAAYGNATSDIEAYENVGIPKEATWTIGPNAGGSGTTAVSDYPSHLPTAEAWPPATIPAPPSAGWPL